MVKMKTQTFSRLRPDYLLFLSAAALAAVGIYWLLDSGVALLSGNGETHWVQALLPDDDTLSHRLLGAAVVVAIVAASALLHEIHRYLARPLTGLSASATIAKTPRPGVEKVPTVNAGKTMDSNTVYREASKNKVVANSIEAAERRLREATAPMLIALSPHAAGYEHLPKIRRLSAAAFRKGCVLVTGESNLY